jgi:hypothetical protein
MYPQDSKIKAVDDQPFNDAQVVTTPKRDHKETLTKLIEWTTEAEEKNAESLELAEKCRRYYDSDQWTSEEKRALAATGQAPVVINRVKPKMDGLMGMEKSNKTTCKAYPRTPKHHGAATAATEAIRYVLQANFYDQIRSQAFENLLIEGTGGIEVCVDKKTLDVQIKHILHDRLIYDPLSRRKDYSDARYLGQYVWMDLDEAEADYPDGKEILQDTFGQKDEKWCDSIRKRVKIVELYWHEDGDVKYACFTRGGFLKTVQVSPYKNDVGETQWPYEYSSLFAGKRRYGAVNQILDVQDEINKRRSKALHLMSVRQIRIEDGAVPDVNKLRQELAKPDGVAVTTPGMEFEILKTGDMAAAQFNLLTEAKNEIDAVSYSAAAAGKETRNMSGVALRSREAASQTELAPVFDVLRHLDIRVYRKVWNCIRQYWKEEKWIRVTDDERNLKWVGLNSKITKGEQVLEQAKEQGAPPEALQALQMQIQQDPTMQEKVSNNEVADLDVDIILEDAPDTVTTQVEDFQVLGEMVKSGFQMPPEAVIEASPLNNKDKLLKMMKEARQGQIPPQVQEQMKTMQEEGKKLAEENQKLKAQSQDKQMKLQADTQEAQATLALKKQTQDAELALQKEKIDGTFALEKYKADAQIRMDTLKMQDEKMAKQEVDNQVRAAEQLSIAQTDVLPNLANLLNQALAGPLEGIKDVILQMVDLQRQSLDVATANLEFAQSPKQMSLSNIQRDATGRPVGAVVTPTLQ